jgi:ribosomal protein L7/L12
VNDALLWVLVGGLIVLVVVIPTRLSAIDSQLAEIRRRVNAIAAHLNVKMEETGVPAEVLGLVQAGRKIDAIKAYRAATGAGLAEAKKAVEQLEAQAGSGAERIIRP